MTKKTFAERTDVTPGTLLTGRLGDSRMEGRGVGLAAGGCGAGARAVAPTARGTALPPRLRYQPAMRYALRDRWLVAQLAAGFVLRMGLAAVLGHGFVPLFDDLVYIVGANQLLETGSLEEVDGFVRPPLYFAFLAAAMSISSAWAGLVLFTQSVAGTLTALPVYAFTRDLAGVRAARWAAAFLLFDPTLVAYAHLLWPETLFLLLVSLAFFGVALVEPGRGARAALLGVLVGVTMLLKPVFGLFGLVLVVSWLVRHGGRGLPLALAFGLAAVLVVAPWVVRNQLRYGPTILLENQGPYNLWVRNDPRGARVVQEEWRELGDAVTRSRVGLARGSAAIAADPDAFLRKVPRRIVRLWGLEFFVLRNAMAGSYGNLSRGAFLAAFWLLQLAWAAQLGAAALGVRAAARAPAFRVVLAYTAVFCGLIAFMVATTRFRVPFAFPLTVAAGVGIDRLLARRIARRDLAALAVALIVLAVSASSPLFRRIGSGSFESPHHILSPEMIVNPHY